MRAVTQPRVRLVVELDPGVEPIQGLLRDESGAEHGFAGWLELTALLDAAGAGREPAGAFGAGTTKGVTDA
jgi:hypothetical protein